MIFKQHSFWQSETIHKIFKEVSDELGVSYDDVGKVIRHMFISVKQELTSPKDLTYVHEHKFIYLVITKLLIWKILLVQMHNWFWVNI